MEPQATRKAQSLNALNKVDNDSDLFLALAKIFWTERKAEKIKKWLKNAGSINKDNGDAWIHLLRYEMEFGTKESIEEVTKDFVEADPKHGFFWTKEVKMVENWRANRVDILKRLAKDLKLFDEE